MGTHSSKNPNVQDKGINGFTVQIVRASINFVRRLMIFRRFFERHLAFHIFRARICRYPDIRMRSFEIRTTYSCFHSL
jgi:hypothetical protein